MRSIMLCNDAKSVHYVYSDEMLQQLAEIAGLDTKIYSRDAVLAAPEAFADVDMIAKTNEVTKVFLGAELAEAIFACPGSFGGYGKIDTETFFN